MKKKDRLQIILDMIDNNNIDTQEEICARLKDMDIDVTQATVSRDVRELGLTKVSVSGSNKQKYVVMKREEDMGAKYARVLRDGYVSMDNAQNILVIKTISGMAMAVAAAVDALKFPEVVGSIAGDDTIMIAVRTVEDTERLMERITDMMSSAR